MAAMISFEVDGFRKQCLMEGLDDIGLTLQKAQAIDAYEETLDAQPGVSRRF